jgi:hypothetical protein
MKQKETGVEELKIVRNMLDMEGDLHEFSAEQILRICRAVRACEWDIYPAQLPFSMLRHAARTGTLSKRALVWIEKHFG